MKPKTTNANLLLCDILHFEMEYYKQCARDGLDPREKALQVNHFFKFLMDNAKKLAVHVNRRNASHTKYINHKKNDKAK
jgi:hypothetical protein